MPLFRIQRTWNPINTFDEEELVDLLSEGIHAGKDARATVLDSARLGKTLVLYHGPEVLDVGMEQKLEEAIVKRMRK
jgi:hypothetical protein